MTFTEYVDLMRLQMAIPGGGDVAMQTSSSFGALLLQRLMRNLQSFTVSKELKLAVATIHDHQHWMVLTEPSCGDSSQLIPIIVRIAECSHLVSVDFVLRNQHPELMDAYLTDGKRSIPKLVAFDKEQRELFRWGPRPRPAQELFEQSLKDGLAKQVA